MSMFTDYGTEAQQKKAKSLSQGANPFQQQDGQDNNVEQQAIGLALRGPEQPAEHPTAQAQSAAAGAVGRQMGQIQLPASLQPSAVGSVQADVAKMQTPMSPEGQGAAPQPNYTQRGQYGTFNATSDKYNRPWDQMSERYKMQTVLSNFDPNKGITPEVLAALNGANINGAKFAGHGDKLDASNLQAWEGYDGRQGIGDVIQGFNDPAMADKHTWGAWQPEGGAPGGGPQPTMPFAMGNAPAPDLSGVVGDPRRPGNPNTPGAPGAEPPLYYDPPRPGNPNQPQAPQAVGDPPRLNNGVLLPNAADPFAAMGGGVQLPGGQWVPKNHPLAATAGGGVGGGSPQAGAPLSGSFAGDWQGGFRPPDSAVYKPGQLPGQDLGTYNAHQFSQFSAPDQSAVEGQQSALLQKLLGSTSMSDQNVAQLQEQNKEGALSMQHQLQDQMGQSAAARGVTGGGAFGANQRRLGEDAIQQILKGNRDISLQKMTQDRADQTGAMGLANETLNSRMNRATQGYGAQLAGQGAQAGENFKAFDTGRDQTKFALDRALSQEGLNKSGADSMQNAWGQSTGFGLQNKGQEIQRALGEGGLALDRSRLGESGRQFDLSHLLANKQFQEQMRQYNGNLGLNYNQLNQSANDNNMAALARLFGGG